MYQSFQPVPESWPIWFWKPIYSHVFIVVRSSAMPVPIVTGIRNIDIIYPIVFQHCNIFPIILINSFQVEFSWKTYSLSQHVSVNKQISLIVTQIIRPALKLLHMIVAIVFNENEYKIAKKSRYSSATIVKNKSARFPSWAVPTNSWDGDSKFLKC